MGNSVKGLRSVGIGLLIPIGIILIWQVAGNAAGVTFPVPSRVVPEGWQMLKDGTLETALSVSIRRVAVGFGLAALFGIATGLVMGFFKAVETNFDPILQSLRMVAAIALVPLAIIWFGPQGNAAVFIVAYGAFFPIAINTIHGVKQVDRNLVRIGATMGLSKIGLVGRVALPASLPAIVVGLRLGLGAAWGAIVAAELTVGAVSQISSVDSEGAPIAAASGGIGFLMFFLYDNRVQIEGIIVAMIAVGAAAYAMDRLLMFLQSRLLPWADYIAH